MPFTPDQSQDTFRIHHPKVEMRVVEQRKIPEEKEAFLRALADALGAPFLHPDRDKDPAKRKPGTKTRLEEIWDNAKPEQREELQKWLLDLWTKGDMMTLKFALGPTRVPNIQWYAKSLNDVLDVRRRVLSAILRDMRAEAASMKRAREEEAKAQGTKPTSDTAFREVPGKKPGDITTMRKELEEIEDIVFSDPPDPRMTQGGKRNPLYLRGNPYLPHFGEIQKRKITLARIEQGLAVDTSGTPDEKDTRRKDREATLARIGRAREALTVLENMDPIGHAKAVASEYRGGSDLFQNKVVYGALVAILSLLSVLSLVPVLRKLWQGEEVNEKDWPVLAYTAGALHLMGFLPKGKEKASIVAMEVATRLQADFAQPFRDAMRKMGGARVGIDAAKELKKILTEQGTTVNAKMQKLLKQQLTKTEISPEDLKELVAGKNNSPLFLALTKEKVTGKDRKEFLQTLLSLPITAHGRLEAAEAAMFLISLTPPSSAGAPAGTPPEYPPPRSSS